MTKDIIIGIKETIERTLEELNVVEKNSFIEGELTAYIDCLEMIQDFDTNNEINFGYDIEEKYPLI